MNCYCCLVSFIIILELTIIESKGILQPRPSETREVLSLDGLWQFRKVKNATGIPDNNDLDLHLMPVPSSYNDISTQESIRDYVGVVWYHRKFFVPKSWKSKRVWIRFGSVCYHANVTINGEYVIEHSVGHLPFVAQVTSVLKYGAENEIIVAVNNTLYPSSVPQGATSYSSETGILSLTYSFDFFNYAGIDRPVVLYTTGKAYVDDVTIHTHLKDDEAIVSYNISVHGKLNDTTVEVSVLNNAGKKILISASEHFADNVTIPNPKLWWPLFMDPNPGYLYKLRIDVLESYVLMDRYEQPFGIRELTWDNTSFKINGKKIYLRGFGRHEDSDIRGKGLDLPLIIRDHNLIKWIGANSYRTSHYPYAEEIMDLADEMGIMIIDECPSVNTDGFTDDLLANHKRSLKELIKRDKNRPSIIMWSAANEPRTQHNTSGPYFKKIVAHIKSLDTTRPVTIVNAEEYDDDYSGEYLDILGFNRYNGWYEYSGMLEEITPETIKYAQGWYNKHKKPVLIFEYGADTLEGLHTLPTFIWTEEYQTALMSQHFKAFDYLREQEGWFIGEMIWNFADFKTGQTYTRVGGNKKGIFTRNRQPKTSAFWLRKRYWGLASLLDNATVPTDLDGYILATPEK